MSQEIYDAIEILGCGLSGSNGQAITEQLKTLQRDRGFVSTLVQLWTAAEQPINDNLDFPWSSYRNIAGVTLKNCVVASKTDLGEELFAEIGNSCLRTLWEEPHQENVNVAAGIVVKMTCIVGLQWWGNLDVDIADQVLNQLLSSDDQVRVLGGLTCLEYFMEDGLSHIADAVSTILEVVNNLVMNHPNKRVRSRALALVNRAYEIGDEYEWAVDNLGALQQGLVTAALTTCQSVNAVANGNVECDDREQLISLKMMSQMIYFLDHICPNLNGSAADEFTNMFGSWVSTCASLIQNGSHAPDAAKEACEFINNMAETCHRMAHEGAIGTLIGCLDNPQAIAALVEYLFPCMLMKDEEANEIMENDSHECRDMTGARTALSKKAAKIQDEDLSEEALLANLRASASKTLFNVCKLNPIETFPHVLRVLQEHWTNEDWHFREVSMLALSCVANGAYEQCQQFLPDLIPQLCQVVEDDNQNPIVMSMAIYTLSLFSAWVMNSSGNVELINRSIAGVLNRFVSTSKRIQNAAVTGFRNMCKLSLALSEGKEISAFGEQIVSTILQCIPNYHSNNLCTLSDLVADIGFLLADVPNFTEPLNEQISAKYGDFQATFAERYDNGNPNTILDCDVFHIASMLASIYENMSDPNPDDSMNQLNVWTELLETVANREIMDDAQLVLNPLHLVTYFIQCLDTNSLTQWHHSRNCIAIDLALNFMKHDNEDILISCLDILYRLLNFLGNQAVQDPSAIINMLVKHLNVEQNMAVALDSISVLVEIMRGYGSNPDILRLVGAAAGQVRNDAFSSALEDHAKLACRVGSALTIAPQAIDAEHLSRLALVASSASNIEDKHEGTQGIMAGFMALQDARSVDGCMHDIVRLANSWQTEAADDTFNAIQGALQWAQANASDSLNRVVGHLPQGTQNQMMQLYNL